MKNFALTGVAGFVAPRHLRAIRTAPASPPDGDAHPCVVAPERRVLG